MTIMFTPIPNRKRKRGNIEGFVTPARKKGQNRHLLRTVGDCKTPYSQRCKKVGIKANNTKECSSFCCICLESLNDNSTKVDDDSNSNSSNSDGRMENEMKIGSIDCCQHIFHSTCIHAWSQINNTCPLCKKRFHRIYLCKTWNKSNKKDENENEKENENKNVIRVDNRDQSPSYFIDSDIFVYFDECACQLCGSGDDEQLLLLCDGYNCSIACHTYCIGLGDVVPDGDWFCKQCCKKYQNEIRYDFNSAIRQSETASQSEYDSDIDVNDENKNTSNTKNNNNNNNNNNNRNNRQTKNKNQIASLFSNQSIQISSLATKFGKSCTDDNRKAKSVDINYKPNLKGNSKSNCNSNSNSNSLSVIDSENEHESESENKYENENENEQDARKQIHKVFAHRLEHYRCGKSIRSSLQTIFQSSKPQLKSKIVAKRRYTTSKTSKTKENSKYKSISPLPKSKRGGKICKNKKKKTKRKSKSNSPLKSKNKNNNKNDFLSQINMYRLDDDNDGPSRMMTRGRLKQLQMQHEIALKKKQMLIQTRQESLKKKNAKSGLCKDKQGPVSNSKSKNNSSTKPIGGMKKKKKKRKRSELELLCFNNDSDDWQSNCQINGKDIVSNGGGECVGDNEDVRCQSSPLHKKQRRHSRAAGKRLSGNGNDVRLSPSRQSSLYKLFN